MKRIAMLLGFSLLILVPILEAQVPLAILTASDGTNLYGPVSLVGNTAVVVGGYPAFVNYLFVKPTEGWRDMTETAKLTTSDGAASSAVSVFDDTVAVVASGATYIFVKPASGWADMTETAKLTTSDGASAVTVSVFGNTVAVAASGGTYIFVKPVSGWKSMTQTAILKTPDVITPNSVSIFTDTVAVGGFDKGHGAVFVFVRPADGWKDMYQTARLTSSTRSSLAQSVATNAATVVAGGGGCSGLADYECSYIFVRPATGWKDMTETARLKMSYDPEGSGNRFGASVAVSVNGNVAAIGAPCYPTSIDGCGPGAVFLYAKGKGWHNRNPYAVLGAPDNNYVYCGCFGSSVSMSGQFGIISFGDAQTDEAYIFGPAPQ